MTRWKKILFGCVLLLLLLVVAAGTLLGTTPGLHLVLNTASRWVPGLHIGQVQGGWRDLTLRGVRYEMPGVSVSGGEIHLGVKTSCLWHSSLCINDLSLRDISIVVDSSKRAPSEQPPEDNRADTDEIATPYPIQLRHVGLYNLNITADGTHISLADFTSGLDWQGRKITLYPTRISNLQVALPTVQRAVANNAKDKAVNFITQTADQAKAEQQVKDQAAVPQPALGETLRELFSKPLLDLPAFRLPADVQIDEILGENLRMAGRSGLTVNRLLLKAQAVHHHFNLETLSIHAVQGLLNVTGQADLQGNWPVNLTLNSTLNMAPVRGQKVTLALKGNAKQQLNMALNFSGPVKAQLKAMAQPAVTGLPFSLNLISPRLSWPLTGSADIQADNLNLNTSGKATDYVISLRSAVSGASMPPAQISLDGKGNTGQFTLDKLRIALLEGNIDLTALADWKNAISWRSELTLKGINTGKQYPDWPATLNGVIEIRGSAFGGSWQVRVPRLKLTGNVKQAPIYADGSLRGNSYMQWDIARVNIGLGKNSLHINGHLDDKLSLDANVNAPALDNTLPGLDGSLTGQIKARGDLSQPQLLANLKGHHLRWQETRLQNLTLAGEVTSAEQISGKLALHLQKLHQQGVDLQQILLDASGNEQAHQLTLKITGKPVAGQLALKGHFDRQQQRWQGTLNNTRFDTPAGDVSLSRVMSLDYQNLKQRVTIGSNCWLNKNAELCVPEPIVAGPDGHARLQIRRFDLAMVKDFLPADTKLQGQFAGDTWVNWTSAGGLPAVHLSLSGKGVQVKQKVNGKTLPVAFDRLDLKAGLANGQAQLQWLISLVNNGKFQGNVRITDPQNRRNLGGTVSISNFSLALLNPVLGRGESLAGELNSQLRLGGNLQNPRVFGQLALGDVKAVMAALPVQLSRAYLKMVFNGMSSALEGRIQTTDGHLNLSGNADWHQPDNWRAKIAAKGERIRLTVPPMVRMDVSPDLTFEATPAMFNLDGRVEVPWARIVVQEVPESAAGVSSDEVMLDEHLQPVKPGTSSIAINSHLIIHVGDDVRLSAFGLNAQLNGDLSVAQGNNGLGLNGQFNVPSGRFHAYGQDLIVRKGQLQFSGPPEQPYVNLEAIRNPDATANGVTAGIRVTGLADEPKVEIFSDPAMSQQEALSYLLRGQGLGSDGDSNALTSALIGLGVAQSGQVMGKIGETFGVSNLALDTAGTGDSQQVQVSGYVLPGLQVKYGVGLFDSLATLTLRYRLMPKLYLEAVSGVDQALDLLYQFEF